MAKTAVLHPSFILFEGANNPRRIVLALHDVYIPLRRVRSALATVSSDEASTVEARTFHAETRRFRVQKVPVSRAVYVSVMGYPTGGRAES